MISLAAITGISGWVPTPLAFYLRLRNLGSARRRSLSQLTHFVARRTGLEPAASGVTGRRYNQLNYRRNGRR